MKRVLLMLAVAGIVTVWFAGTAEAFGHRRGCCTPVTTCCDPCDTCCTAHGGDSSYYTGYRGYRSFRGYRASYRPYYASYRGGYATYQSCGCSG